MNKKTIITIIITTIYKKIITITTIIITTKTIKIKIK